MELMTCARPYAQAVFQAAREHNALGPWHNALKICAAVVQDKTVAVLLGNPSLTDAAKAEQLLAVCGDSFGHDGVEQSVGNFIHILAEHKRLPLLPLILEQFEQLKTAEQKQVEAEVISAFPLTEAQQQALIDKLQKKLATQVSLTLRVDESLLGGVMIRVGDLVIDSSVQARLKKLAEAMLA